MSRWMNKNIKKSQLYQKLDEEITVSYYDNYEFGWIWFVRGKKGFYFDKDIEIAIKGYIAHPMKV